MTPATPLVLMLFKKDQSPKQEKEATRIIYLLFMLCHFIYLFFTSKKQSSLCIHFDPVYTFVCFVCLRVELAKSG